jgi:hypothetical protein
MVEYAKTVVLAAIRVTGVPELIKGMRASVTILAGSDKAQHLFEGPLPAAAHGLEPCPVANTQRPTTT